MPLAWARIVLTSCVLPHQKTPQDEQELEFQISSIWLLNCTVFIYLFIEMVNWNVKKLINLFHRHFSQWGPAKRYLWSSSRRFSTKGTQFFVKTWDSGDSLLIRSQKLSAKWPSSVCASSWGRWLFVNLSGFPFGVYSPIAISKKCVKYFTSLKSIPWRPEDFFRQELTKPAT